MRMRTITANPSQIIVEQLAASGVKYVFNNSGSREAHFFDALHTHADIHGILALHEGSVTAMAGGYAQVKLDPAVMVVHLGAGLAQSLGQLINVWNANLPVVVITFAGDTGSFTDRGGLDLDHNFGPTSISKPFVKAAWSVLEAEGLPQVIYRALQVAQTPPVGPVHIAIYDRLLDDQQVASQIMTGDIPIPHAGYPADSDIEALARSLAEAERPLFYVGDGVWKRGAEAQLIALAERFGVPIAAGWGDTRSFPIQHPLHCGRFAEAAASLNPDQIICLGARHWGRGSTQDFSSFLAAKRLIAIGADLENLKNIPGLDLAILADERRTLERLNEFIQAEAPAGQFNERRRWAQAQAAALRAARVKAIKSVEPQPDRVRPWVLAEAIDQALEDLGGGLVMIEQYAVPFDTLAESARPIRQTQDRPGPPFNNVYLRAAGPSEGYGVGGTVGVKLAAPDKPVVGLVGDGSLCYADSGLWTAVQHGIPVLYIIANNQSYGIVANAFGGAGGAMRQSGEYAGVVLSSIDPVKLAEGFGLEGRRVQDEERLGEALKDSLEVVEREGRPFLLDVRLPLGLPKGGRAARPFCLAET